MAENRIWFVETLTDEGLFQYHISLGGDVPQWLRKQLDNLVKKKKLRGFRMIVVDDLVVRAADLYDRLGLNE